MFPCGEPMLQKPRVSAFIRLIRERGEHELMNCLARNERDGVVYHYKGELTGDYDRCGTQQAIEEFVLSGRKREI